MNLISYEDSWEADDPHANFKEEVSLYSVADPLPTLKVLSQDTDIPVEALIRYILVKYTASGSDAVLAMTPLVLRQMQAHVEKAERVRTAVSRLEAYEALRQMIGWLVMGLKQQGSENSGKVQRDKMVSL
ncbi:hypothetical protein MNBD_CHLOROFLEXI01-4959 [hydrothermal vent metagenome]|uniref:Uncharacterized protein n=1 Tax=hydrothermal vent metagenome TaxID=652676 RepID=A0A3B0VGZ2_9ZZZZ